MIERIPNLLHLLTTTTFFVVKELQIFWNRPCDSSILTNISFKLFLALQDDKVINDSKRIIMTGRSTIF